MDWEIILIWNLKIEILFPSEKKCLNLQRLLLNFCSGILNNSQRVEIIKNCSEIKRYQKMQRNYFTYCGGFSKDSE